MVDVAALLLLAQASRAPADEPIRFEYRAPGEVCPAEQAFVAQVRARTTRWRIAAPDELARTFVVDVAVRADHVTARLVIRALGAGESARDLTGARCDAVVDGIALMAALAIDPSASTAPVPPPTAARPPAPAPPVTPVLVSAPAPAPATPPAASRWQLAFGAGGGIVGVLPDPSASAVAFVDASWLAKSAFAPALRLDLRYARSTTVDLGTARARFDWTDAAIVACPWRLRLAGTPPAEDALALRGLYLQPCAGASAGVLRGAGVSVPNPATPSAPWIDARALARFQWALGAVWLVEVEGGAVLPLLHPAFHFDTTAPSAPLAAYRTPAVAGFASAGVAVRFP